MLVLGRSQIMVMAVGGRSQKIRQLAISLGAVRVGVVAAGKMQSEAQRAQSWCHPRQKNEDRQQHSTAGTHARRSVADGLWSVK